MWYGNMGSIIWLYDIQVCFVMHVLSECINYVYDLTIMVGVLPCGEYKIVSNICYVYIRWVQTTKQNLFYTTHKSYHTKNENLWKELLLKSIKSRK